jgi:branched-chain amino acid transport system permease protein
MQPATLGDYLRRSLFLGVIAALAAIYVVLVGIVPAFEERPLITGVLGIGLAVPIVAILVIAYYAGTTPRSWTAPAGILPRILAPIVTGTLGGAGMATLIVLSEFTDPREVLPKLTPQTAHIIGLGNDFSAGALLIIALGFALGALAAVFHVLATRARRALVAAIATVAVFGLIEPLLRVMLLQLGSMLGSGLPAELAGFLYQGRGLTPAAALVIFLATLALALGWQYRGDRVRQRYAALPARQRTGLQLSGIILVALTLLVAPAIIGSFLSETVGTVGLFLLMGLGLNIVVGYAGLLDLGYVAFFAVGAYATALFTSPLSSLSWEMNFWLALPLVMLVAALTGIAVGAPVLRLRGDYLAIVTLGFGEIVRILLLSDWLRPIFGGAQGILSIPAPELFGINFFGPQQLYYPILISVMIAAVVAWSLANSRVGRAWNAMREDEDVAEATGINTTRYKLLAFAFGAVFGCLAGAFFSIKIGSIFPHRLDIVVSITVLSAIILGGMGSIRGVIVGALVLVGLPELLREFGEYRLLIYGVVLVSMMLLRPEGLLPSATRRRELHEEEPEETQYEHRAGGDTGGPGIAAVPQT